MSVPNEVKIEPASISDGEINRARALGSSLVILPSRQADDGRGIYPETTIFLVKELRAQGIDATYLHPSESRQFEVRKSALPAVATLVLGVVSTAAWDAIRALVRRSTPSAQPLEITYVDLSPDGPQQAWTVKGPADKALDAIDRLRLEPPSGPP